MLFFDLVTVTLAFKFVQAGTKHIFHVICRKSVQQFPRYFIHNQKKPQTDGPKTEPSAVHCMW